LILRGENLYTERLRGIDSNPPASTEQADEEFVRLLKGRSVAAWEMLFERNFHPVYRYALSRLMVREAAEDVAASTFHRAFTTIDRYSYGGRPVLAWLYGIARNAVNEARRSETRHGATELLKSLLRRENGHGSYDALPLMQADNTDTLVSRVDLQHALRGLTEIQREVVLLRYFAGLTAVEAGQVIGRPETAIYALQARALAALRRRLT
jgi:RNA polymerase sigma-70 factor, ECF subfamily